MADSTYQENGHLHYLRLVSRDSVRDSWLWSDTIFNLAGNEAGMLRRFQGRYYLNTPDETGTKWWVQRLEISGRHLRWQTLVTETSRMLALVTAIVRHHREKGISCYRLTPAPGPQTRHLGHFTELRETAGEYGRRRQHFDGYQKLLLPLLHLGGHFALVGLQLLELDGTEYHAQLFLRTDIDALQLR